jgi:phage terminase large subunit GpA-like protein
VLTRPENPQLPIANRQSPIANALKDSTLVLAGGAQFGKTILELYLAAYITSQRFLNLGVYLPDDGLADAIVDTKFRPVVIDNIGWFAEMTQIGKAVNKSGKAVNSKGAFLVTDGERKAVGIFRGLKRIPTSFSLDVIVRDEEDDIPRDKAKFLSGRLTASALRLQIIIGTQRVAGAGQNKQWEQGSQGVVLIGPVGGEFRMSNDECRMTNDESFAGPGASPFSSFVIRHSSLTPCLFPNDSIQKCWPPSKGLISRLAT